MCYCFQRNPERQPVRSSGFARRTIRSETRSKSTVQRLGLAEIEHVSGRTQKAIAIVRETLGAARSSAAKGTVASYLI